MLVFTQNERNVRVEEAHAVVENVKRYLAGPSPLPWSAASETVRVGDVVSWDQRWRPLQTSTTLDTHQATFHVLATASQQVISLASCAGRIKKKKKDSNGVRDARRLLVCFFKE